MSVNKHSRTKLRQVKGQTMGRQAYSSDDDCVITCQEVAMLNKDIAELKAEIKRLKNKEG